MEFVYLGERPEFIALVSRWYFDEWGGKIQGMTLEKTVAKVSTMLHRDKLPLHLLAVEADRPLGVVQLKWWEMDIYPDKAHWLGGVYVDPGARSVGLATQLIGRAMQIARDLGVVTLHLQTERLDGGLYARLGWQPIEKTHYNGFEVLVMQRPL